MPIPEPRKGETMNKFISRCITDELMKKEYPSKNKRLGMCYSQWDNKRKKKK